MIPPLALILALVPLAAGPGALTIDGTIDVYASADATGANAAALRVFDATTGSIVLSYAELALGVAPGPAGFRLDIGFGPVADLTSLDIDADGALAASEALKHVQQAYGSFAVARGLVIDVGKFVTTAGAEVIEAKDNWSYSRSLLFGYAIPFTHTGIRATATLSEVVTLEASVVNGWELIHDDNLGKTFGSSMRFALPSKTGIALTSYTGPEGSGVKERWRTVFDFILSQSIGGAAELKLNADYGAEDGTRWGGAALMAQAPFGDLLICSARAEAFFDPDGVRTGAPATVGEATLTAAFPLGDGARVIVETRGDAASAAVLNGAEHQLTGQVAFLAWF